MKYSNYHFSTEIHKNLELAGFRKPTDIQYKSIPPILKGQDLLAIAQTGTGKTAAFVIPVLQLLLNEKKINSETGIKCLVMVPTRELALQIKDVFEQLSKNTKINSFAIFGGIEQDPQIKKLEAGFDVLIATPGRMFDLTSQGYLKLDKVKILILDEADHMLALGFINDIRHLIRKIPHRHQTLFFSATLNEEIKDLAYSLVYNPIRIQISPKDPVSKNIIHFVCNIKMDDKRFFLERLIKENPEKKMLVFVRTKVRVERVFQALERVGISSATLHGDKDQKERLSVLDQFKKDKIKIVITTDVSARGIDIPNVDFVINYDLPEETEYYVHRIGRTGRATKKGIAVSFCSPDEKKLLLDIEDFIGKKIDEMEIKSSDYEETINISEEYKETDWKSLIEESEKYKSSRKRKK